MRASWDEVAEIIAAAHVYTVKRWGPDRIAGFSPIPAMSPVSYASGARFLELIGAPMLSFYDWYADLPNASPQMFGDQTDVPESGDWWDAGYLMMWGSNVPTTRTPDAHWMTEARYRGQKVVAVAPDYAESVKFADEWVSPAPGTDGALAMAMGHVVLKEFFADASTPFFESYTKQFTDLPHLVCLEPTADGAHRPGKFLVEGDLGGTSENAMWKPAVIDAASGEVRIPHGSIGDRFGEEGEGRWNLELGDIDPALSMYRDHQGGTREAVEVELPRFDAADGKVVHERRGVPVARVGDRVVTTVLDLLLAQYGVAARGPARHLAARERVRRPRLRRPGRAGDARVAGAAHRGARRPGRPARAGVGAERDRHRGPRHDPARGRRQPLVPLRPDLPRHPAAHDDHRHARAATAGAGRTTSGRRRSARSWASSTWPSRWTGTARRAT